MLPYPPPHHLSHTTLKGRDGFCSHCCHPVGEGDSFLFLPLDTKVAGGRFSTTCLRPLTAQRWKLILPFEASGWRHFCCCCCCFYLPGRSHSMEGGGLPSARHSRITVSPPMAVVLCGAASTRVSRTMSETANTAPYNKH